MALRSELAGEPLGKLPQPEPEGGPQRIQIEKRITTGGPEEGAEGIGPVGYRPMLKVEDQRKLADLRVKFLKQAGPLESDLKVQIRK